MKFETLKRKCADEFYRHKAHTQVVPVIMLETVRRMLDTGKQSARTRDITQEFMDEGYKAIMNTDIRCIDELSEAFPNIVPAWMKSGRYTPELSDDGWELVQHEYESNY